MPAQSETSKLVWPTVEQLREDNQHILDAKQDALTFQRDLMSTAWLCEVHEQLLRVRMSGLFTETIKCYCPNGLEQPDIAAFIVEGVVETLRSAIPGALITFETPTPEIASITIDWSIRS